MKGLNKFSSEYFLKYKEKPVKILPYSSHQTEIAQIFIRKIKEVLKGFEVEILERGSTLFKIAGKGDVEIGVYPENKWKQVISILTQEFGEPENKEDDYVRFNNYKYEHEVEIIILKGREAVIDKKLHRYLLKHSQLLKKYEEIKIENCHSKRQYQIAKNEFLTKVIDEIPENY